MIWELTPEKEVTKTRFDYTHVDTLKKQVRSHWGGGVSSNLSRLPVVLFK